MTTIATVGAATGLATPVAAGTTTISAAFGGATGTATLVVGNATVVSIAVTPATPSIAAGTTSQFKAVATLSDTTTQDVTSSATWQSGTLATATIASGGLATGVAAGTSTITATFGGKSGTATLTVTAAKLTAVTISPPTIQTIPKGNTIPFTAKGTYSDNTSQDISTLVTWSSAPTGIVAFTGATATGAAVGTTQVTAVYGGLTSNATTVTVTNATLASIAVTPATPGKLHIGATQQFTATGTYSDKTTGDVTATANWASSTAATATIVTGATNAGLATGVAGGSTNITASVGTITSPAIALTVSPATLVTIAVAPVSANLAVGGTQQFKATGTYSDATTQDLTSVVAWTATNNGGSLTTDFSVAAGLVTGVSSTVVDAAMTAGGSFPWAKALLRPPRERLAVSRRSK